MSDQSSQPDDAVVRGDDPARTVRVRPLLSLFLWALAIALGLYFFMAARLVLLGLLGAACLAAAAEPIKRLIPGPSSLRGFVAGGGLILVILGALAGLAWLLADTFKRQFETWPQIKQQINDMLAQWTGWLDEPLTVDQVIADVQRFFSTSVVGEAVSVLAAVLVALALLMFGTVYLLTANERLLLTPILRALPQRHRKPLVDAVHDLVPRLRWWVIGTLTSMVIIGSASWGAFELIGLKFALPLAMVAGIAEIVPTVGPASALLLAMVVAATQGTQQVLLVLAVWFVIQTLESYVIVPMVMKEAIRFPPVVTLFTVVLWAYVLGPGGLVLALPLNLVIWRLAHFFVLERSPPLSGELEAALSRGRDGGA